MRQVAQVSPFVVLVMMMAGCDPAQGIATQAAASEAPIDHEAAMEAFMGGPLSESTIEHGTPTTRPSPRPTRTRPAETAQPASTPEPTAAPQIGDIEVLFEGVKRPHGIGIVGDTLYVSSEVDRGLNRIAGGASEPFARLNFPHDMIAMSDGSLITPVFLEDRVVRISAEGEITELASGLSGPNGIAEAGNGRFYVSNYFAGTVVLIGNDAPPQTIAARLNGPAGLAYNKDSNTLYVAEYLNNRIAVIKGDQRDTISLSDLVNVESLFVTSEGKLLATAALNGKGVVVEVREDGDYEILISTDLPGPLVGHFRRDGYVYLVSPNDREGRILTAFVTQP